MWGVLRYYNLLRAGVTWKGPEVIELWYNQCDSLKGSVKTTTTQCYHYYVSASSDNANGSDDEYNDNKQYNGSSTTSTFYNLNNDHDDDEDDVDGDFDGMDVDVNEANGSDDDDDNIVCSNIHNKYNKCNDNSSDKYFSHKEKKLLTQRDVRVHQCNIHSYINRNNKTNKNKFNKIYGGKHLTNCDSDNYDNDDDASDVDETDLLLVTYEKSSVSLVWQRS